ncbi:hypothetical protein GCM10027168_17430 [Streptomyces capparidis]
MAVITLLLAALVLHLGLPHHAAATTTPAERTQSRVEGQGESLDAPQTRADCPTAHRGGDQDPRLRARGAHLAVPGPAPVGSPGGAPAAAGHPAVTAVADPLAVRDRHASHPGLTPTPVALRVIRC